MAWLNDDGFNTFTILKRSRNSRFSNKCRYGVWHGSADLDCGLEIIGYLIEKKTEGKECYIRFVYGFISRNVNQIHNIILFFINTRIP